MLERRSVRWLVNSFFPRLALVAVLFQFAGGPPATATPSLAAPGRDVSSGPPAAAPVTPLAGLLKADGTLDLTTGFQGALEVSGWSFGLTEDGRPRFEPAGGASGTASSKLTAAAGDSGTWDGRFTIGGADQAVLTVVAAGSDVYFGGFFLAIGSLLANRIAKYDMATGTWSTLGNGFNAPVTALAVSGGTVYAGGGFTQLCGNADCTSLAPASGVNRIASFSSGAWSPLGNGVNDSVLALAVSGSTVYAGGTFRKICADSGCSTFEATAGVNRIAAFNSGVWSPIAKGLNDTVSALAVGGNTLYAGGTFVQACSNDLCTTFSALTRHIAKFEGGVWSALDKGLDSGVSALVVNGTTLYIGGSFSRACADALCVAPIPATGVNAVAMYTGTVLSPLNFGLNGLVTGLAVSGGTVYAAGTFTRTCGNVDCTGGSPAPVNRVASFTGVAWSGVGNGLNNAAASIAVSGGNVYAGGGFSRTCANTDCSTPAPPNGANRIAAFSGGAWSGLTPTGNSPDGLTIALAVSGTDVYIGGAFSSVGPVQANRVAKFNSTSGVWSSLGNGLNGAVFVLAVNGNDVYAGGEFTRICADINCSSVSAASGVNNVAKFSAGVWSPLEKGLNQPVLALTVDGDDLYAGGKFNLRCLADDCLTTKPAIGTNRIARFSAGAWSALDKGLNGDVNTIVVTGTTVYAGGAFTQQCNDNACIGQKPADGVNRVAKFSAGSWSPLGKGVNNIVYALAVNEGTVYVGGMFSRLCKSNDCSQLEDPNGVTAIAAFNGSTWSPLANGLAGAVNGILVKGSAVYAAGGFTGDCSNADCSTTNQGAGLNYVAAYRGASWSSLGNGVNVAAARIAQAGDDLYAIGVFSSAGLRVSGGIGRFSEGSKLVVFVPAAPVNFVSGW